jgi:DNA-binding IclR family transcriptional regulator
MLERVVAILDAVGRDTLTATEIAERTGLSKSTAHRVAQSMETYEFLSRDTSGGYAIGRRMLAFSLHAMTSPHLVGLREKTGETAQLWVRQGDQRVCVKSFDSPHRLRVTEEVGRVYPLVGSAGRILASENVAETVGEAGWIESIEERTPGLSSVSAPVMRHGTVVAAVCLAMPVARVKASPGQDYGHLVVAVADDIAAAL